MRDSQERYDDEFLEHWKKGLQIGEESETTVSSSSRTVLSSRFARPLSKLSEIREVEHFSDIDVIMSIENSDSSHLSDHRSGQMSPILPTSARRRDSTDLVFLPELLEIQTVHLALRHPRTKSDVNPTLNEEPDQCQLMNYHVMHSDLSIDDRMNIFRKVR